MQAQSQWYLGIANDSFPTPAEKAYKEAIAIFELNPQKYGKLSKFQQLSSIVELQNRVDVMRLQYERRSEDKKVARWLSKLSSRICHYGRVFDVLVQHHPEYVSLAWGAMKLLFTLVENHGKQVRTLAKGLAQIADALPRIEFSSILYPTIQMKQATSEIYSKIVHFLMRAAEWFSQGKLRHAWEALSRPVELVYDDLIQDIEDCARKIDMLATAGAYAEQRDMHLELQTLSEAVQELRGMLVSQQSIQTSASLDTNRRLTDLQLNQVMDFLSNANALDPMKALQYRTFICAQTKDHQQQKLLRSKFWTDSKFSIWDAAATPSAVWLKGDYSNRAEVQSFAIEVIKLLRSQQIPVLWALKSAPSHGASATSPIDLIKGLVCQALQLNVAMHTESSFSLSCVQFRAASTLKQWFDLLAGAIRSFSLLYIVVDIDAVGNAYSHGASWMTHLFAMFDRHASEHWIARLKILLVSWSTRDGQNDEVLRYRNSIVFARSRSINSKAVNIRSRPGPQTLMGIKLTMAAKRIPLH